MSKLISCENTDGSVEVFIQEQDGTVELKERSSYPPSTHRTLSWGSSHHRDPPKDPDIWFLFFILFAFIFLPVLFALMTAK